MKNKNYLKILIIILLLSFLIIFSFIFESQHPVKEGGGGDLGSQIAALPLSRENVKVSLMIQDKKYETQIKDEETVFGVMKKIQKESNKDNLFDFKYTEHPGLGIFINEISGKKGGRDGYWIYYVNGVEASIGVSNYKIKDGDVISWKYEK